MSAAVSAPVATPKQTDPATGFAVLAQPIALAATSPVLASGTPLTSKDPVSGRYVVDNATAKAGFTFGVLLYRNAGGAVDIYDGKANWIPQASFDPSAPNVTPTPLAFDPKGGGWSGIYLLSSVAGATAPAFPTASGGSPKYGFLAVFATPKTSGSVAVRSALGAAFGVAAADGSRRAQPGLLRGLNPAQDPTSADGFAIVVDDATNARIVDLILSSETTLPQNVMVRVYSGGVVRATIGIAPDGSISLSSATRITLDAPNVGVTGTLYAQNIEYVPYGTATEKFL